ncbi:MAG: CHC2 zinc finger domain-containing protein [Isosphaeraceae bacterium]
MTATTLSRIDWKTECDRIDLESVAANLLGQPPGRRGGRGRSWWRCPLGNHEDINPSFSVKPGKTSWKCFGCGQSGDAADLVMRIRNVSFTEALEELVGKSVPSRQPRPATATRPASKPEASGLPFDEALALVLDAERRLWTSEGADALDYLRGPERGLEEETIKTTRLGFSPGVDVPKRSGEGTYHVSGIVVPWLSGDRLQLVKVRQPEGRTPKYAEVYRSERFDGIYPGRDAIRPGQPLAVVEGEFDTLLLGQELGDLAGVVTLGSASNGPSPDILDLLTPACLWLIATDADEAGDRAAATWEHYPRSLRVRPPTLTPHPSDGPSKMSTDWTDLKSFGVDLRRWWSDVLAGIDRPPLFSWEELAGWRWGPIVDDPEPDIVVHQPFSA